MYELIVAAFDESLKELSSTVVLRDSDRLKLEGLLEKKPTKNMNKAAEAEKAKHEGSVYTIFRVTLQKEIA
jgi:hypothetical protein